MNNSCIVLESRSIARALPVFAAIGLSMVAGLSAKAQTLTTLYSLCSQRGSHCPEGRTPAAPLLQARDGNSYGTTVAGGANGTNYGRFFKVTPNGQPPNTTATETASVNGAPIGEETNGMSGSSAPTVTAPGYNFVTIEPPGSLESWASGLNSAGQIVGFSEDLAFNTHYYLYVGGTFSFVKYPGQPYAINDSGQVVGYYYDSSSHFHGFVYTGGSFSSIDYPGAKETDALGINGIGQIVGNYRDLSGHFHGFLFDGGSFTSIDYPGSIMTEPDGINDSGEIVGNYQDSGAHSHGFVYSGGSFSSIDFPGGAEGSVTAINNSGQIAGYYWGSPMQGFVYAGGSFTSFKYPGANYTFVQGINDGGQVVGSYRIPGDFNTHGFLATTAALHITTTKIPSVGATQAYLATLAASGGSGTGYTWCVQSGSQCVQSGPPLPDGFTLFSTGILSSPGSPAAAEDSYNFTVQVTDSAGNLATQPLKLVIGCPATVYVVPKYQYMLAQFVAPDSMTLSDYAAACGFASFSWQQLVTTLPGPSPFQPNDPSLINPQSLLDGAMIAPAPFFDPPPGAYTYMRPGYNPYPFYYPSSGFVPGGSCTVPLENNQGGCPPFPYVVSPGDTTLSMVDAPADRDLPAGASVEFSSALVGVSSQPAKGANNCSPDSPLYCTTLYAWTWNSTFNGTAGGTAQTASIYPIDPGSGTGGITITSINGVPVPTVTVTPSSSSVTTAQTLSVTVDVSGGSSDLTPTGSITLTGGGYTSSATALSSGSATINVPAGSLASGTDTLTANYKPDTASAATCAVASGFTLVTVTTPAEPIVSLSPTTLTFGPQQVGTPSSSQAVTLTNTGNASLAITSIATNANFGQTNNCATGVAASGSCTISVTFTPTTTGPLNESLTISDNALGSPQSISLSGTGTAPAVSLSPSSLTFGNQNVGTASTAQNVTLTNVGSASLTISTVAMTGANSSDFVQTNNCITPLAPGGMCNISTQFSPSAPGERTAILSITDNAFGVPQTLTITGTGVSTSSLGPNIIYTVAGGGLNGSAPLSADLPGPSAVYVDAYGNVFFTPNINHQVFRLDSSGALTVVAGNGLTQEGGDGGLATSTGIGFPSGVSGDKAGNLYIATDNKIRRVAAYTGIITTVAGNGNSGFSGDGGPATSATFNTTYPMAVTSDAAGNLYIPDTNNNRVRRVDAVTGIINTIAGNGTAGFSGDGGSALSASLNAPIAVAVDKSGNVFISDQGNNRIRRVDAGTGVITTVAGNGSYGFSGDGGPATSASLSQPQGVAVDVGGNMFIADRFNGRVRRVDAATGNISTVAGNGSYGFAGDGGPATTATLGLPQGIAVDASDNLFIADANSNRLRRVDGGTQVITTIAGGGSGGDGGAAISGFMGTVMAVKLDHSGNMFIVDNSGRVRRVDASTGVMTTYAGLTFQGFTGDGVAATSSALNFPFGLDVDSGGNVFIADTYNSRIRRVDAGSGLISTVAGTWSSGYSGDGGPATNAALNAPRDVAVDASGNLFIADTWNNVIRRMDASTGTITTVVGNGTSGFGGDGGPAASALLNHPTGVTVDSGGNLFIADAVNQRIRRVNAISGIINTVAGNGTAGLSGDGGPATSASLNLDTYNNCEMAVDSSGNLFIADPQNNRIRRVDATTQTISTVAGTWGYGLTGDGGPATSATLATPLGVAVDGAGNLFIADTFDNRVREVSAFPFASLASTSIAFGNQPLGTSSSTHTVTLKNTGSIALKIGSVTASGDFKQTNTCGGSLASGASCTFSVRFAPKAAGPQSGAIALTDESPGGMQTITLTGTGIGRPTLSATVTGKSKVGTKLTVTLQLTNVGTGDGQNIQINTLALGTLGGKGTVTYAGPPALPIAVGNLAMGASTTVALTLNVPATVTKFSMNEHGTVQDTVGDTFSFSPSQLVFP